MGPFPFPSATVQSHVPVSASAQSRSNSGIFDAEEQNSIYQEVPNDTRITKLTQIWTSSNTGPANSVSITQTPIVSTVWETLLESQTGGIRHHAAARFPQRTRSFSHTLVALNEVS